MPADEIFTEILDGASTTLILSVAGWTVAAATGLVIAIVRQLHVPVLASALTAWIFLLRSVPQLVLLYLLFFGLGSIGLRLGAFASVVLALGITDAAFTAEAYRAGFGTVSERQREAGTAIGLSRLQVLRHVVLPQTVPFLIPPLLNTFVGLLKTATIASAVGAPEILYRAQGIIRREGTIIPVATAVILVYVAVTLPLTYLVGLLETRVRARGRAKLT